LEIVLHSNRTLWHNIKTKRCGRILVSRHYFCSFMSHLSGMMFVAMLRTDFFRQANFQKNLRYTLVAYYALCMPLLLSAYSILSTVLATDTPLPPLTS